MTMKKWIFGALLCTALMSLPALADEPAKTPVAEVSKAPKEAQDFFDLMTGALQDKNYEGFTAPLDDASRGFMSKALFDKATEMFGTHLAAGYEAKYLDVAKKENGAATYLWKLTFTDKSPDAIAIMSLKGTKVGMFFFL